MRCAFDGLGATQISPGRAARAGRGMTRFGLDAGFYPNPHPCPSPRVERGLLRAALPTRRCPYGISGQVPSEVGARQALPPGVKQQYMDQIMGQMGLHGGQGGGGMHGNPQQRADYHLTGKQQQEIRAKQRIGV